MSTPAFNPTKSFKTTKKVVAPEPLIDDEIEAVLDGEFDPKPRGTKEVVIDVEPPAAPKVERRSININSFEAACAYIQGLKDFDFTDPRGTDVADVPWMNYQKRFMESIGEVIIPHALYAEIGGTRTEEQRAKWGPEKMKAAVVAFLNRNADASKSGYQYRIEDWRVVPIDAPKIELGPESTQVEYTGSTDHSAIPTPKAPVVPETRTICTVCSGATEGFPAPEHCCELFQAPITVGVKRI